MQGKLISLTDGTKLEVKVNFGTMYYLQKNGARKLMEHIDRKQKKNKRPTDDETMEVAAQIIYALLRSNGRDVSFDEALSLLPPDAEGIEGIIEAYQEETNRIKKKQQAKKNMKTFAQK